MKKPVTMLILFIACTIALFAQKQPPRFDKPGTFTILSRTNYTLAECGFTRTEMTDNLQKITELINTIRKNNLVLSDIVGFEGRARIYNTINCTEYGGYGVPSRISFEFCTWYLNSGKEELGTIEPPEWSIFINKILPNSPQFSASGTSDRFSIPAKKETIEPGIDVYGDECYVIYNPDRPPYWLPLTVKEAYEAWIDVWKNDTGDKTTSAAMLDIIEKKYAAIPESDLNKPAYDGGPWPTAENNLGFDLDPIMHVNPDYWDKSLPKSAVQFIYFRSVPNKNYYRRLKEERKIFDSDYHLLHFQEMFDMNDIRALILLIEK
jgi:hypothetical protein